MERRFHVVFTGRLHAGFKHAETVERMVELFQLDKEKVTKLLFSGRPTIIKRDLSREQARKYYHHLERIGLRITIIEAEEQPPQVSAVVPPVPSPAPAPENPAPVREGVESVTLSPPIEALKTAPPEDPDKVSLEEERQDGIAPPFKVECSHGWLWIKEACGMFCQQPLTWTAMVLLMAQALGYRGPLQHLLAAVVVESN